MKTSRAIAAAWGTLITATAVVAIHGLSSPKMGAGLHPFLSYDAAAAPDSGPLHTQWIQCTGIACLVKLARLRDLLDIQKGLAHLDDGGNLVATPQGFTSSCVPTQAQPWCPPPPAAVTTHYLAPESNGTGAYRFAIFDRDWPLIAAIIAADAALADAGLPAPAALALAEDDAGALPVEAGIEAGGP